MKTPKFTDLERWTLPYANASATRKEGYLRNRMRQYLERVRRNAEEVEVKVKKLEAKPHRR